MISLMLLSHLRVMLGNYLVVVLLALVAYILVLLVVL
jgi:hypothetical protein